MKLIIETVYTNFHPSVQDLVQICSYNNLPIDECKLYIEVVGEIVVEWENYSRKDFIIPEKLKENIFSFKLEN